MKKALSTCPREKAVIDRKVDKGLQEELRNFYSVKADIGRKVDQGLREELRDLYSVMELNLLIGQGVAGEEVAWLVVTAIPSLLKVPFTALGLKEAEDGNWVVMGQRDKRYLDATVAQEIASLLAVGLASRAFSAAAFLLLAELPEASAPLPEQLTKLGLKSVLLVPMRTVAHKFGVLMVGSEVAQNYTSHQKFLIGALANQVAVALENTRLIEQARGLEERYRSTLDSMLEGCQIIGYDWRFIYVNDAAARHWRQAKEELLGRTIMERHPGIEHTELFAALQRCMDKRIAHRLEGELIFADRSQSWFELSSQPVAEGVFVLSQDITERKRAEEALRESEHKYRALFDSTLDGAFVIDAETMKVVLGNEAAAKIYGFDSVEDGVGANPLDFVPPDDRERVIRIIAEDMFEKDLRQVNEFRTMTKDGREIWISAIGVRTEYQGRLAGLVSFRDITERKKAGERLARLSSSVEMATDSIVISDIDARIIDVNEATLRMYGTADREELVGRNSFDLIAPEDRERALAGMKEVLEKGYIEGREYHVITKHGARILVEMNSAVMKDGQGKVTGFVATSRDISERKQAEEELRQSFKKLRRVFEQTVAALASLAEKRDPYTAGHQRRMTRLACAIAEELSLPEEQVEGIRVAGTIHDVGKTYIPAEILNKPGKLTDIERALIETHPQVGYEIVKGIEFPWLVAQAVLQHHERLDGSGYPAGLSGEEIILEARILGVADVVEAMSSHRPFRPALGVDKALEEMSRKRGVLYDAEVVDACLKLFAEKGFEFE